MVKIRYVMTFNLGNEEERIEVEEEIDDGMPYAEAYAHLQTAVLAMYAAVVEGRTRACASGG